METSLRAVLAEKGMSIAGLILLQILMTRDGPATATDLADGMMVTNGAITGFLDRLEEDGLITRTRMSMDRRVVLVEATEKARSRFEKLRFVAVDELTQAFHGWNEYDIKKLLNLLNRLGTRNAETQTIARKTNGISE
jgi:DNA-binding MarR family transcriptional regulator